LKRETKRAHRSGNRQVTQPAGGFGDLAWTRSSARNAAAEFGTDKVADFGADADDWADDTKHLETTPRRPFDLPTSAEWRTNKRDPLRKYGIGGDNGTLNPPTGQTAPSVGRARGGEEPTSERVREGRPGGNERQHDPQAVKALRDAARRRLDEGAQMRAAHPDEKRAWIDRGLLPDGMSWDEFWADSEADLEIANWDVS